MKRRQGLALAGRAWGLVLAVAAVPWLAPPAQAQAQAADGREILDRMERLLWGRTVQGEYEMTVRTPSWERTLGLRVWMDRPGRSFIRILSPAKEAGIGSLRLGAEMWNYLPNIERVVRVPPSMMLQAWMGSDFTNDDLVKESSLLDDYTHEVAAGAPLPDGEPARRIVATPKPGAAVVWGRIVVTVRQRDAMPISQVFFSERGEQVRELRFSDIRQVDGRSLPTRWEMQPAAKPGHLTTIVLKDAVFDRPIDDSVFTHQRLQRP